MGDSRDGSGDEVPSEEGLPAPFRVKVLLGGLSGLP
jgi:hypothetical protein